MNPLIVNKQNEALYRQRNILLGVCLLMVIGNILLGVIAITKRERTIIIPALKEQVEIIGEDGFSESYIEQMTLLYTDLLLNLTPDNIEYKSRLLLKHVDSRGYQEFIEHYKEEEKKYKKYRLSTRFDITDIKIIGKGEEVEIRGVLNASFGKGAEKQSETTYLIGYSRAAGRLLIKKFEEKKNG